MQITIGRRQRDAIYGEVVVDLSGVGDIQIALDDGDFDAARRFRRRFEEDMRLLDDIGWEPDPEGEEFVLSMPAVQLASALRRLSENARAILHGHIVRPIEESEQVQRTLAAQAAYGDLLGQLAASDQDEGASR
jgi:hypothetical protein